MNIGDRVECTAHNGQHKGKVVALMGGRPGIAWDDSNRGFPTNGLPQYPDHFIKGRGNHRGHLLSVDPTVIRKSR